MELSDIDVPDTQMVADTLEDEAGMSEDSDSSYFLPRISTTRKRKLADQKPRTFDLDTSDEDGELQVDVATTKPANRSKAIRLTSSVSLFPLLLIQLLMQNLCLDFCQCLRIACYIACTTTCKEGQDRRSR